MELTSAERFFSKSMGVLAVIFLVAGLVFLLANEPLIRILNWVGERLDLAPAPYEGVVPGSCVEPLDTAGALAGPAKTILQCDTGPVHHLWLVLTFTLMMTITYISFKIWRDVRANMALTPVLILSKFVSSATGLGAYFLSRHYFADLLIIFVDFPIFLFVLWIYWRAKRSRDDF